MKLRRTSLHDIFILSPDLVAFLLKLREAFLGHFIHGYSRCLAALNPKS